MGEAWEQVLRVEIFEGVLVDTLKEEGNGSLDNLFQFIVFNYLMASYLKSLHFS